jgi:hypothetical protein
VCNFFALESANPAPACAVNTAIRRGQRGALSTAALRRRRRGACLFFGARTSQAGRKPYPGRTFPGRARSQRTPNHLQSDCNTHCTLKHDSCVPASSPVPEVPLIEPYVRCVRPMSFSSVFWVPAERSGCGAPLQRRIDGGLRRPPPGGPGQVDPTRPPRYGCSSTTAPAHSEHTAAT